MVSLVVAFAAWVPGRSSTDLIVVAFYRMSDCRDDTFYLDLIWLQDLERHRTLFRSSVSNPDLSWSEKFVFRADTMCLDLDYVEH